MISKLHRGGARRHGLRLSVAFYVVFLLATAVPSVATAAAPPPPPYVQGGRRWLGTAPTCTAPAGWIAERLFRLIKLPGSLADLCRYTWVPTVPGRAPTNTEVTALFSGSGALELTEDVAVLYPATSVSAEEEAVFTGLRTALRAQVGDALLLPSPPASPAVRIVVIDTAPDAAAGHIHPGLSRHGDTLAHLIEDLVCPPADDEHPAPPCAAEVTTTLALPWLAPGIPGPDGGHLGTLSDLARAIERAIWQWQTDRATAPASTPARLLLNLSVAWEHAPRIADCSTDTLDRLGPPARAVRAILQHAASQGALIVAAAGNDSGGPTPRTGLVCPGRYQAVPQDANPSRALLVAVSGVDYHDDPLATARPAGITGIAGLGLGGVAWDPADPVPPSLTGSSVATAVVSAAGALVWAYTPSWAAGEVIQAVYTGGIDVGAADACPMLLDACRSHRTSVCGALQAAGASPSCAPAAPAAWSGPDLHGELAALDAASANLPVTVGTAVASSLSSIPRYLAPTVQVEPTVFPQPISATCPTCRVAPSLTSPFYLSIPARGQELKSPVLVVLVGPPTGTSTVQSFALGTESLAGTTSYAFPLPLPSGSVVQAAYLSGLEASGYSLTEEILVQQ